jgi:arylsulfatase A-like enzyme
MASCAAIAEAELPGDAAEDSYNMLPVLLDTQGDKPVRQYMLTQTPTLKLAIRNGDWKYLDHQGSGGNNYNRADLKPFVLPEADPTASGQLYNLKTDPGETTNLSSKHPEKVRRLKAILKEMKDSGRSAPERH